MNKKLLSKDSLNNLVLSYFINHINLFSFWTKLHKYLLSLRINKCILNHTHIRNQTHDQITVVWEKDILICCDVNTSNLFLPAIRAALCSWIQNDCAIIPGLYWPKMEEEFNSWLCSELHTVSEFWISQYEQRSGWPDKTLDPARRVIIAKPWHVHWTFTTKKNIDC